MGQTARFERFAAKMLYIIAAGEKIDTDKVSNFSYETAELFKNPFEKAEINRFDTMSADEIKEYIRKRMEDFANGSA